MKTKIPVKFISILLIIDFTLGLMIVYQSNQGKLGNIDTDICEQGSQYSFTGFKWNIFPIRYHIESSVPFNFLQTIEDSIEVWDDITNVDLFVKSNNFLDANLVINYKKIELRIGVGTILGLTTSFTSEFDPTDSNIVYSELTLTPDVEWDNLDFSCRLLPISSL